MDPQASTSTICGQGIRIYSCSNLRIYSWPFGFPRLKPWPSCCLCRRGTCTAWCVPLWLGWSSRTCHGTISHTGHSRSRSRRNFGRMRRTACSHGLPVVPHPPLHSPLLPLEVAASGPLSWVLIGVAVYSPNVQCQKRIIELVGNLSCKMMTVQLKLHTFEPVLLLLLLFLGVLSLGSFLAVPVTTSYTVGRLLIMVKSRFLQANRQKVTPSVSNSLKTNNFLSLMV